LALDKYKATWVSHSSISDFLKCPRLYFLNNVYKDPYTNHKICLTNPYLSLGQAVHEVVESLSTIPVDLRFKESLLGKFDQVWESVSGLKGGFKNDDEENLFKQRGRVMLQRVMDNPGPLLNKAIKIKGELPSYYLSEDEEIILCGKIDWLEYIEKDDSIHIIDFKTGKVEESDDSLQLSIYDLITNNCQTRKVSKASYWYLERDNGLVSKELPPIELSYNKVFEIAKEIKKAKTENNFKCKDDGCFACRDLERVVNGEGKMVGVSGYNKDVYVLD